MNHRLTIDYPYINLPKSLNLGDSELKSSGKLQLDVPQGQLPRPFGVFQHGDFPFYWGSNRNAPGISFLRGTMTMETNVEAMYPIVPKEIESDPKRSTNIQLCLQKAHKKKKTNLMV